MIINIIDIEIIKIPHHVKDLAKMNADILCLQVFGRPRNYFKTCHFIFIIIRKQN
jgi:hypothetical protein